MGYLLYTSLFCAQAARCYYADMLTATSSSSLLPEHASSNQDSKTGRHLMSRNFWRGYDVRLGFQSKLGTYFHQRRSHDFAPFPQLTLHASCLLSIGVIAISDGIIVVVSLVAGKRYKWRSLIRIQQSQLLNTTRPVKELTDLSVRLHTDHISGTLRHALLYCSSA